MIRVWIVFPQLVSLTFQQKLFEFVELKLTQLSVEEIFNDFHNILVIAAPLVARRQMKQQNILVDVFIVIVSILDCFQRQAEIFGRKILQICHLENFLAENEQIMR